MTQLPLKPREAAFVCEYLKDFKVGSAAERIGMCPATGTAWMAKPHIAEALAQHLKLRAEFNGMDAEWLLKEMRDNHYLARQAGELSASNAALKMIAGHTLVDANATTKVEVIGEDELVRRLSASRAARAE